MQATALVRQSALVQHAGLLGHVRRRVLACFHLCSVWAWRHSHRRGTRGRLARLDSEAAIAARASVCAACLVRQRHSTDNAVELGVVGMKLNSTAGGGIRSAALLHTSCTATTNELYEY